jgi:hypothetical protein
MSREPWKRAYALSRSRPADGPPAPPGSSPLLRRRVSPLLWVLLGLVVLGGGGWYLWQQRGALLHKYDRQLPEPVKTAAAQPEVAQARLDVGELDGGLGIGLAVGGDYMGLMAATRPWKLDWKVTVLGQGHVRITLPGLKVYADNGRISSYELDVPAVYADKGWTPWQPALRKAGLTPDLNWRTATGQREVPPGLARHELTGGGGHNFGGVPAQTAYTCTFNKGWLTRVEAGLKSEHDIPEPLLERPAAEPPAPPGPSRPPAAGAG